MSAPPGLAIKLSFVSLPFSSFSEFWRLCVVDGLSPRQKALDPSWTRTWAISSLWVKWINSLGFCSLIHSAAWPPLTNTRHVWARLRTAWVNTAAHLPEQPAFCMWAQAPQLRSVTALHRGTLLSVTSHLLCRFLLGPSSQDPVYCSTGEARVAGGEVGVPSTVSLALLVRSISILSAVFFMKPSHQLPNPRDSGWMGRACRRSRGRSRVKVGCLLSLLPPYLTWTWHWLHSSNLSSPPLPQHSSKQSPRTLPHPFTSKLSTVSCWFALPCSQVLLAVKVVKNLPANAGDVTDTGSVPVSERSPGGGHGNPLQYSCLENPHGQRSLASYSPRGHKESDMTEVTEHAQILLTASTRHI